MVLFFSYIFPYYQPIDRYMAPEVFKHRKYDKKVDVFSFAMIFYEVILILAGFLEEWKSEIELINE